MSTPDHVIVACIVGAICGIRILWDMSRWSKYYRRWTGVALLAALAGVLIIIIIIIITI